jgi:hypothetical protein
VNLVTRGYGKRSRIITRGYGSGWRVKVHRFVSRVWKRLSFTSRVTQ